MTAATSQKVFQAIALVSYDLSIEGIAKAKFNDQQKFNFRGIDDVLNALSPILVNRKLVILPTMLERTMTQHQTKNGGNLFVVAVKAKFTLVNAEDGSNTEVIMFGEGMDSGDKATNKAMSAAYKYMAIQTFCIPTQADESDYGATDVLGRTLEIAATVPPEKLAEAAEVVSQAQAAQIGKLAANSLTESEMADIELAMREVDDYAPMRTIYVNAVRKAQASKNKDQETTLAGYYEKAKKRLADAGVIVPGYGKTAASNAPASTSK